MSMEPIEGGLHRQAVDDARETLIHQTIQPAIQANSLTFHLAGGEDGTYNWAILSPRMSASIAAQNASDGTDVIRVDAVNTGNQSVTINAPSNGSNRTISLAVGGFSGGDPAERRWYELLNINVAASQSISAQVNDRGGELLIRNTGPTLVFELRVHYGMSSTAMAVRPSVSLEANRSYRIAPQEWDEQTITETTLHLSVFDSVSGAQIAQREL